MLLPRAALQPTISVSHLLPKGTGLTCFSKRHEPTHEGRDTDISQREFVAEQEPPLALRFARSPWSSRIPSGPLGAREALD